MRCLSKDELILFYYDEVEERRKEKIKEHLNTCSRCRKLYEETKEFMGLLKANRIEISPSEIETIVRTVKTRIGYSKAGLLTDRLDAFLKSVFRGFTNRRPLVPVIITVIVFLLLIPFLRHKRDISFSRNLEIIEVEMELSLEDEDASEFDIYYNFDSTSLDSSRDTSIPLFHRTV